MRKKTLGAYMGELDDARAKVRRASYRYLSVRKNYGETEAKSQVSALFRARDSFEEARVKYMRAAKAFSNGRPAIQ